MSESLFFVIRGVAAVFRRGEGRVASSFQGKRYIKVTTADLQAVALGEAWVGTAEDAEARAQALRTEEAEKFRAREEAGMVLFRHQLFDLDDSRHDATPGYVAPVMEQVRVVGVNRFCTELERGLRSLGWNGVIPAEPTNARASALPATA